MNLMFSVTPEEMRMEDLLFLFLTHAMFLLGFLLQHVLPFIVITFLVLGGVC